MLKVDVDDWLFRLEQVYWPLLLLPNPNIVPVNIPERIGSRLMAVVPEELSQVLHPRILRKLSEVEGRQTPFEVMIVLDGDSVTREQFVFEMSFGPVTSPDHVHNRSPHADYGEKYWTLAGALCDVTDDGRSIVHRPGHLPLAHRPGTRHQPYVPECWIGVFYQPAGSFLPT